MYLFHSYKETIRLLDSEGRTHVIPPNKAWEVPVIGVTDCSGTEAYTSKPIPAAKAAQFLAHEGANYGVVIVKEVQGENGITFDLKQAAIDSARARASTEDGILQQYVKGAKEDELAKQPVKPPSTPILAILEARGLDLLRDFGIRPVGHKTTESALARDAEMERLKAENSEMRREQGEMKEMLTRLLKLQEQKQEKVKA